MQIATHIALGLAMAASGLQVHWHQSTALGTQTAGRLEQGVRLPAQGRTFFTWDPVLRRAPNRAWRRWGTDRLVRVVLLVAHRYHAAHPRAARMAIGDLSRPHGGDFGPQYGYIGHASHQNGLDVDVYYPRADGRERAPRDATRDRQAHLAGARGPLPGGGRRGDLRWAEHGPHADRPGACSSSRTTTTTSTCGLPG